MATNSQRYQESGIEEGVRTLSLRETELAKKCCGASPGLKYKNLEEWLHDNFEAEVTGEAEDVQVVRTFYTSRATGESDIDIWYADVAFGFYEGLPQRVAKLCATHVVVEYPRSSSGINPKFELYVHKTDEETGKKRPLYMNELIETVIHDDDEWKAELPGLLTRWELTFPKGQSSGIMRVVGYPESPGPSRNCVEWTGSDAGGCFAA